MYEKSCFTFQPKVFILKSQFNKIEETGLTFKISLFGKLALAIFPVTKSQGLAHFKILRSKNK